MAMAGMLLGRLTAARWRVKRDRRGIHAALGRDLAQSPGVAATINGRRITVRQLADECIARYGREMLENEINFKLLSQELKKKRLRVTQAQIDEEVARAAEAYGYVTENGPDVDK
jgi:hypothetical protein